MLEFAQTVPPDNSETPLLLQALITPFLSSNETLKYAFFISLLLVKNREAEEVLAIAIEALSSEVVFKKPRRLIERGISLFNLSAMVAKLILKWSFVFFVKFMPIISLISWFSLTCKIFLRTLNHA
jgi:hypothetical protein